ncbi:SAV_2336 N-terminal domain-related protein [Streptomyces sp. NPDC056264]|uniref:SAV_2336 N-terminal domain-related protein n=1 Tax=Streptomyces sp. NPDC056264 TaxID=3345767 RepID=UPI003AAD0D75
MAEQPRQRHVLRDTLAGLMAREHGSLHPEDVADVLWISRLARLAPLPAVTAAQVPNAADPPDEFTDAVVAPGGASGPSADQSAARPATDAIAQTADAANGRAQEPRVRLHGLPGETPRTMHGGRAHVVQVTRPPALSGVLNLSRALRPLREWVDSHGPPRLDEEATAQATSEAGHLLPIWTPAREPRFSVDLLVDTGATMAVWHDLASELYTALEVHGAFANVHCWALSTDQPTPRLSPFHRRYLTGTPRPTPSTPWQRPLADPTGRRIVLVLTDGVGPAWYGTELPDMLANASRTRPTAALQVLPRRLWHRTALPTAPVEARTADPGRPGATFRSEAALPGIPRGIRGARERAAVRWLPVMEVDGTWLGPWAELAAGRSAGWVPMLAAPVQGAGRPRGPNRADAPESSAATRVARFRSGCSPNAYRLACHLAAAPLSLPVMRLVQQATVPGSGQTDLAEIFLSGLIEERSGQAQPRDPDEVVYDFRSGVREELLAELTRGESLRVLEQVVAKVSGRIAATFGGTLDFRALAATVGDGEITATGRSLPEQSLPFAEVAVAVLRGAGGQHRSLAQQLEAAVGARPQGVVLRPAGGRTRPHGVRTELLTAVRQVASPPDLPYMVGRQNELSTVTEAVGASLGLSGMPESSASGEPACVIIEGTPGMGRNRLVQEYVRLHGDRHSFIHWINARRRGSLREGLLGLWQALAPADSRVDELPPLDRLWKVLAEHRDWLVVLDGVSNWPRDHRTANAGTGEVLPYGFPPAGKGCVLATTDALRWRNPRATVVRLGQLTRHDHLAFLQTALEGDFDPADPRQREELERMASMMPRVPDQLTWADVSAGLAGIHRPPGGAVSDTNVPRRQHEGPLEADTGSPVGQRASRTPLTPEEAPVEAVPERAFRVPEPVVAMASLSRPGGRVLLATLSSDRRVSFWDPETGSMAGEPFGLPLDSVLALAAVPDSSGRTVLATIDYSGRVHLWNSVDGRSAGTAFRTSRFDVLTMTAFQVPDGRAVLAISDYDGRVRLWDLARGTQLDTHLDAGSFPGRAITMIPSPHGGTPLLATADYSGEIRLRNTRDYGGQPAARLTVRPAQVLAMAAFSDTHGRSVLATTGYDRIVRLWDVPRSDAAPASSGSRRSWTRGSFMAELLPEQQDALQLIGVPRDFDQGDVIFRHGDPSGHLMLIRNGWAKVTTFSASGHELLEGLRGAGDLLGDSEFLDGGPRPANMVAVGRVQVLVLKQDRFQDLLDRHPDVLRRLARVFTARLRHANRRLTDIATKPVAQRLATVLLELAQQYGIHTEHGVTLPVSLNQHELAGAIGAAEVSTYRALTELRSLGIVQMRDRQLSVSRLDLLRDRAGAGSNST